MIIKRDGTAIELTEQERMAAYLEQQHIFLIDQVRETLEEFAECDDAEGDLAIRFLEDEAMLSDIAHVCLGNIDDHDMDWDEAAQSAVEDALATHLRSM